MNPTSFPTLNIEGYMECADNQYWESVLVAGFDIKDYSVYQNTAYFGYIE